WSPSTRDAVRNEAAALSRWRDRDPVTFAVPAVMHRGMHEDLEVSVVAPLPRRARRYDPATGPPAATVTHEVAAVRGMSVEPLGTSRYWNQMADRIGGAESGLGEQDVGALRSFVRRLEDEHGAETMAFRAWHGDV